MKLAIVGAGRAGISLGVLLARAGHDVVAAAGRSRASRDRVERHLPGVPFLGAKKAASLGEVVLLSVPDDRIREICEKLADALFGRRAVVHLSGANPLDDLAAAKEAGALTLSLHPLQAAPDVETAIERFPGSGFAVTSRSEEGFALGEELAADAGGRPFRLLDEHKPLYHAAAVFCSNYLTTTTGIAERLFAAAGIPEARSLFAPLAEASLATALLRGAGQGLTGPVIRGDAGTLRRNLEALKERAPDTIPVYVTLARAALELAAGAERLGARERSRVEEVLDGWT